MLSAGGGDHTFRVFGGYFGVRFAIHLRVTSCLEIAKSGAKFMSRATSNGIVMLAGEELSFKIRA